MIRNAKLVTIDYLTNSGIICKIEYPAIGPAIAIATNQGNICQMQYAITPKAAIAGMKYNRRRYLSFDLGFADFRSMFELF
jgi:hypothetical protein